MGSWATRADTGGVERVELNPAQQDLLDALGAPANERPQFDAGLRHDLRDYVESSLLDVAAALDPSEPLYVDKRRLALIHGCEARYLAEEAERFEWTVPRARGTVVHKAVELSMHVRLEPTPRALVDEALARLEDQDRSISDFVRQCSEEDRAELRAEAVDITGKFLECFPPLQREWFPTTESSVRVELCGGLILARGRIDLSLGRAQGTTSGKVLIDLKTGGFSPHHLEDLRFYALLETIRLGTPPRMVATYYLDSAQIRPEPVTKGALKAAAARLVSGAQRLFELTEDKAIAKFLPGYACRWCPLRDNCETGAAWLATADREGEDGDGMPLAS